MKRNVALRKLTTLYAVTLGQNNLNILRHLTHIIKLNQRIENVTTLDNLYLHPAKLSTSSRDVLAQPVFGEIAIFEL